MNGQKILFLVVLTLLLPDAFGRMGKNEADPSFQLNLQAPIDKWDEAIPLGNGLTGGLLWGSGNEIRLSLDRGDLWDLRTHPGFTKPGFTYETVRRMALAGLADSLNKEYSRANDYPTKLPGCRLVITLPGNVKAQSFHLDMEKGIGSVSLGDGSIDCFFSAVRPVALMKIPGKVDKIDLIPNNAVTKLGNPLPVIEREAGVVRLIQDTPQGFRYVFVVKSLVIGSYTLISISSATNSEDKNPVQNAVNHVNESIAAGYGKLLEEQETWWKNFWSKSSVSIPDPKIQLHYNLVQYYYGAASKAGAPPMPLQGVWTADAGTLPPWHGDYHHDLNTQLTYWAYLSANHLDQGLSFLDFMWSLKSVHEEFARNFYGTKGMVVPGVMALDGKPMGAWFQYTLSPTMGAWVAQSFYWHWRYSMDPAFLKDRAYPYCVSIAEGLVGLMKPDKNGKLKLDLSSSPEIHNNTQKAWLTPNSNFDLSLIRWIFGANAEMAKAMNLGKEVAHWQGLLAKMDDLATVANGEALLVSPNEPLTESHRHFSHLMAIYPLGSLNIEGSASDRKVIDASLKQMDEFGSKFWCGYSFSWMACMRARVGQSEKALTCLNDYLDCTSRNGFHLNGPQTRMELSSYKMRAFTLEGNFAAAQAVHEMLLQSWGGRIRIFPAVPENWKDLNFKQLRVEGGFLVSAERKDGKTIKVTITATVDQPLRLVNPFGKLDYKSSKLLTKSENGDLQCRLKKGETISLNL
ncbi:MAG: glycoside hydrolase family 95-like protein [Prolixibacteraceae bacterium]